jgi:3-isopropylmalate/(R)-2-methylmalate dehydratase large subunit
MAGKNLFDKVWEIHKVKTLSNGQDQIFIGLHLIHEVTSPQAFQMLKEKNLRVKFPELTFGTIDHIIPTKKQTRPFSDSQAEIMTKELEKNVLNNSIKLFGVDSQKQGIVHVIAPELGLTKPGMTICCGDSHTSTHGAFGSIAFGIGTSQVRDVLATQCIAMAKPKIRKIEIYGKLKKGVYAKDVILYIIRKLEVNGGIGYAYEYSGEVFENMDMEQRMTVCNMSIEGGARCGYICPDKITFDYIKGREYSPTGEEFEKAIVYWKSISSDKDAYYDDTVKFSADDITPMVTWGINPGQSIGIDEELPNLERFSEDGEKNAILAYNHMKLIPGKKITRTKIDVVFIGSCTNGRLSDLREAAKIIKGKKASEGVKAIIVPGSQQVKYAAEKEGLDEIFMSAGFEWRNPGCSMCLGMNPDKLSGDEMCVSSSNRNFIGRMGSQSGRTILMSPAMCAVAAIEGKIVDIRDYL